MQIIEAQNNEANIEIGPTQKHADYKKTDY